MTGSPRYSCHNGCRRSPAAVVVGVAVELGVALLLQLLAPPPAPAAHPANNCSSCSSHRRRQLAGPPPHPYLSTGSRGNSISHRCSGPAPGLPLRCSGASPDPPLGRGSTSTPPLPKSCSGAATHPHVRRLEACRRHKKIHFFVALRGMSGGWVVGRKG